MKTVLVLVILISSLFFELNAQEIEIGTSTSGNFRNPLMSLSLKLHSLGRDYEKNSLYLGYYEDSDDYYANIDTSREYVLFFLKTEKINKISLSFGVGYNFSKKTEGNLYYMGIHIPIEDQDSVLESLEIKYYQNFKKEKDYSKREEASLRLVSKHNLYLFIKEQVKYRGYAYHNRKDVVAIGFGIEKYLKFKNFNIKVSTEADIAGYGDGNFSATVEF